MKLPIPTFASAAAMTAAAIAATALAQPALANSSSAQNRASISSGRELPPYLQCVPFARERTGVQIFGDAHTWWGQAEARYKRGRTPREGAVMAFRPHRNMRLGHVAAVVDVVDDRTVLLSHSNWSPINGRRGQIERRVRAIDVSMNNDWSKVRVWYHPLQALGKTAWPIHGFIYNERSNGQPALAPTRLARASATPQIARANSSPAFLSAFSSLNTPAHPRARERAPASAPRVRQAASASTSDTAQRSNAASPKAQVVPRRGGRRNAARNPQRAADPVSVALARYD